MSLNASSRDRTRLKILYSIAKTPLNVKQLSKILNISMQGVRYNIRNLLKDEEIVKIKVVNSNSTAYTINKSGKRKIIIPKKVEFIKEYTSAIKSTNNNKKRFNKLIAEHEEVVYHLNKVIYDLKKEIYNLELKLWLINNNKI